MKFSAILLPTLAAVAVAQSASTTSTSDTPIAVPTPSITKEMKECLDAAGEDVAKQAECIGSPGPSEDMVNATTQCAAKCDQGNGSEADTKKYADCVQACIKQEFYSSTLGSNGNGAAPTQGPSDNDDDATTTRTSSAVISKVTSVSTNSDGEEVTSVVTQTRSESNDGASTTGADGADATGNADTPDGDSSAAALKAGALTGFAALFAALFAL